VSRWHRGTQWGVNKRLEDLEYADDVCLLAHRFTDIKGSLNDLGKLAQVADCIEVKAKLKK
jgi:hypothetical protein